MADATPKTTHVKIFGATYPIRSQAEPEYVQQVAAIVDRAMHRVSHNKMNGSTVEIAVLAAMNLADELIRTRQQLREVLRRVGDTTDALARVLDGNRRVVKH